jgi:hypothetical protein
VRNVFRINLTEQQEFVSLKIAGPLILCAFTAHQYLSPKELHELHGDFLEHHVCYSSCLQSRLIKTMPPLKVLQRNIFVFNMIHFFTGSDCSSVDSSRSLWADSLKQAKLLVYLAQDTKDFSVFLGAACQILTGGNVQFILHQLMHT